MWAQLAFAIVLAVISYALQPRPKMPVPAAATEMDNPTASAGTPLPVVFGTMTVKSANFLGYWAKEVHEYDTN
jgi:hypothetical protein